MKIKTKVILPKKTLNYYLPTKVFFGRGSFALLPGILLENKSKSILLVVGDHIKTFKQFKTIDKKLHVSHTTYPYSIKKSDFKTINKLTNYIRTHQFDCIVAIGGGAILDSAKCGAILATHRGDIEEYLLAKNKKISQKGLDFIAIPTTAGTGSEVTPWATVWGSDRKKYSLTSSSMFARYAIVDPALTDTLPKSVTAESGIDALCQAIESYWNRKHNPTSDIYALAAIKILMQYLYKAFKKPTRYTRNKVAYGSLLGGLAFSNTQTTICHAVSYPMTSYYAIPHGQATSITLPLFLTYSLPTILPQRREKLLNVLGSTSAEKASKKISLLMQKIGLKTKLSELGISKRGIDIIVREGFHPERAQNAPRVPSTEELRSMLLSIY